ncbi:hypothetical protein QSH46_010335 [Xanthomonas arboricola pv. juglandis]|uniref:hypothetical protein n=1 Tax=Xanthomonas arboricola TaxID=56448 RepID=UPI0002FDF15D|nr:hypothetical protein [Xanthomonas arboricola]MDN0222338.1 hypothetical protein [Xanthomonas arboricola pv. juglandis]MDN0224766.1 hypothetical protein [Xanthomonas arboricola pv. juglandis]MDN0230833.1 hypothetical protein [Xanthomonas arboricola pv. juglandis]MDN0233111.1 hypothetical protein [Xanthomonas arboricola pv. juglandis]MDN0239350.1 hypothetical protein [Xanthomonas arboricola pv. juglandis]
MLKAFCYAASLSVLLVANAAAASAKVDVKKPFAQQAAEVRKELDGGTKYSEISQEERAKVLSALTRIEIAVTENGDAQALTPDRKAAIYNDQELINTILTRAGEESRLICTREKATGSHHTTSICKTVAERRRLRDSGERDMSSMQRRHKATDPGS